jgi:hypothetical protein
LPGRWQYYLYGPLGCVRYASRGAIYFEHAERAVRALLSQKTVGLPQRRTGADPIDRLSARPDVLPSGLRPTEGDAQSGPLTWGPARATRSSRRHTIGIRCASCAALCAIR